MKIVAALFIENIDLQSVPGASTGEPSLTVNLWPAMGNR